ncbi:MAG: DUF2834 domain-containing protein [Candidatus Sericytochromatia bacterium]
MIPVVIHAVLGIAIVAAIVALNPHIFKQSLTPKVSVLEAIYYIAGIAATVLGYYFIVRFTEEYAQGAVHNPFWGPGSLADFIRLGYVNPAASNASQDYTIMSVVLLPLFVIVDGRRRGIRHSWLYFLLVWTLSSALPWAFYLATVERQRRVNAAHEPVTNVAT